MKINKYFNTDEFKCKCGCNSYIYDVELLMVLTLLRKHFNKPVKITSSTRCDSHNKKVGGSKKSQHLLGTAADIQVKDIDPITVSKYLNNNYPNTYGIGKYKTFTHIDVRTKKARWNG